jgi:hypothetical protein
MPHLHLENDYWIGNFWNYILNFFKFQVPQIFNYDSFSYVDGRSSSFQKTSNQKKIIKRIFNLVFYKFNFGVLTFNSPLLQPKLNLLNSSTLI